MTVAEQVFIPVDQSAYETWTLATGVVAATVCLGAIAYGRLPRSELYLKYHARTLMGICAGAVVCAIGGVGYLTLAPSFPDLAAAAVADYVEANDIDVTLPAGVDCDLTRWTCLEVATIEGHTLSHRVDVSGDPHIVLYRTGAER